jgi:hypothetical protein
VFDDIGSALGFFPRILISHAIIVAAKILKIKYCQKTVVLRFEIPAGWLESAYIEEIAANHSMAL